jgi:biotin carboxylase
MSNALPLLAMVFDPVSTPPMRISGAAAGHWHTLWLVDRDIAGSDNSLRLLPRVGTVVEITGLSAKEAGAEIAPHAPSGIIALAEAELPRAAALAVELGLPFHSPEVAQRLVSKVDQRAALRAAGLWVPEYLAMPAGASDTEVARALETIRLPAILKPQSGSSSRNTYRISTAADLSIALREIGASFDDVSSDFILEEILTDGWPRHERPYADYASVETIAVAGRMHHVAHTGRTPLADPFRETGFFTPGCLPVDLTAALEELAAAAIEAMSPDAPTTGAFHTEIKITSEGPRVIEVNGRPGGIWIPEIVEMVGGPSILTLAGRAALGLPLELADPGAITGVGYELQFQAPVGATRLKSIDGVQDIARLPGVRTVTVTKPAGASLDWREGTTGSLFTAVGVAEDHEALWRLRERIEKTADAEFEFLGN